METMLGRQHNHEFHRDRRVRMSLVPFAGRRITLAIALVLSPCAVRAELPPALPPLVTPETQAAINRGLEYLARAQSRDGAWRHQGPMGQYPVAMTALAGLAFLSNGNTTTQGKYAQQVSRATSFILASAGPTGLISRMEEESRSMYGHGFSMLFLGELHGMEEDPARQEAIGRVLARAAELTARSQSRLGGWMYTPDANSDEGSVTITQLQGLRACRNAGIAVPKRTIDNALGYLEKSVLPDGGIAYRADRQGSSRPPITAAAVACWYNAGQYNNPSAVRALDYVKQRIGRGSNQTGAWGHYFYAHLYMAQVMWLSGKANWGWYFPTMRDTLLASQNPDGSWEGDSVGPVYGTAIATVILQIPYGYLPILQR
jgi:hypothetical protein